MDEGTAGVGRSAFTHCLLACSALARYLGAAGPMHPLNCAFTISRGTGMVAANFACSRPTNRVLRNVALNPFGFIGVEAKRKPAVITAWTAPFDVVRLAPDCSTQIDQVAQPFEHCRPFAQESTRAESTMRRAGGLLPLQHCGRKSQASGQAAHARRGAADCSEYC
jgi:hypothetical protein